jgi:hypothetical protein
MRVSQLPGTFINHLISSGASELRRGGIESMPLMFLFYSRIHSVNQNK